MTRIEMEADLNEVIDTAFETRRERSEEIATACERLDEWDRTRAKVVDVLNRWHESYSSEVPGSATSRGWLADDITDELTK
jgi:hypothetical protein